MVNVSMNVGWEGSGLRILIAEDDAIIASLLEQILKNQGFVVTGIASSGEAAITLALQSRPDLMLTNVNLMGPVDEISAVQAIGALLKIPIIFVSSRHQPQFIEKIKCVYPAAFITKPFSPETLYANITLASSYRTTVNNLLDVDWAKVEMHVKMVSTKRSVSGIITPNGTLLYANSLAQRFLFEGGPVYGGFAFKNLSFFNVETRRQLLKPMSDVFNDAMVFGIIKSCIIQFASGKPRICNVVVEALSDLGNNTVAAIFDIVSTDEEF